MELLVKNKICDIGLLTPYIGGIMQLFYEQIFLWMDSLTQSPTQQSLIRMHSVSTFIVEFLLQTK